MNSFYYIFLFLIFITSDSTVTVKIKSETKVKLKKGYVVVSGKITIDSNATFKIDSGAVIRFIK